MREWYVAVTQPARERFAALNVMRRGTEVFLPECKERVVSTGASGTYERRAVMFPRYLFIYLEGAGDWAEARRTPGIVSLLSADGQPRPIDESIVEELRERSDEAGGAIDVTRPFQFQERLTIEDPESPFDGRSGTYLWTAGGRVALLLHLFNRSVIAEVKLASIVRS